MRRIVVGAIMAKVEGMRKLSLFSGIAGIDLAAKMAGFQTEAFCEIEKYPVEVLKKRFPGVPIINDVRGIDGNEYRGIDIISGGFPCQPFSVAGQRKGEFDERHLFPELARIIAEAEPRWVLAENVPGLLSISDERGTRGGVFGDCIARLSEMGYAVGWLCYGAVDVGAPHKRERIFIIANRDKEKVRKVLELVKFSLALFQNNDLWLTPVASDGTVGAIISKDDRFKILESGRLRKINRNGTDGSLGLARTVKIMEQLWPTPTTTSLHNRKGLSKTSGDGLATSVKNWNTPNARDYKDMGFPASSARRSNLPGDLRRLLWSTPTTRPCGSAVRHDFSKPLDVQIAEVTDPDAVIRTIGPSGHEFVRTKMKLNPDWVALLMGFPVGWASLGECEDTFRGWPMGCNSYQYEFEPPRLSEECENRAKQLKCYGNAVVPYQVLPIFEAIKAVEEDE